jgi:hypothetical protein
MKGNRIVSGKKVRNQVEPPRRFVCPDREHNFIQASTLTGEIIIFCSKCGESRKLTGVAYQV